MSLLSSLGLNEQELLDRQVQTFIEALIGRVELPSGVSLENLLRNRLTPRFRTRIWKAILTIYDEHNRLEAIAQFAPYLDNEQIAEAFAIIEQTIRINQLNVRVAIEALSAIAPMLTNQQIKQAVQWVNHLEAKVPWLVSCLAPYLDPPSLFDIDMFIELAPNWEAMVASYTALLPYIPSPHDELYRLFWGSAMLAADEMERGSHRIRAHIKIAEASRPAEREWLIQQLVNLYMQCPPEAQYEFLPMLAPLLDQHILELALQVLGTSIDKARFSELLIEIAPALKQPPSDYCARLAMDALQQKPTVRSYLRLQPLLITQQQKERARELLESCLVSDQGTAFHSGG